LFPFLLAPKPTLRTSKSGTTFAEEMPTAIFSMQHCAKDASPFLVRTYILKYKSSLTSSRKK